MVLAVAEVLLVMLFNSVSFPTDDFSSEILAETVSSPLECSVSAVLKVLAVATEVELTGSTFFWLRFKSVVVIRKKGFCIFELLWTKNSVE